MTDATVAPDPIERCSFDPNSALGSQSSVLRAAAQGDLMALRSMRDMHINASKGFEADAPAAVLFGLEAMPYARLCAAQGDDNDARRLAGVLCYLFEASRFAGYGNRAERLAGEAVAILERLSEAGDETASLAAVQIVDLHPSAGDIAKRLLSEGH